MTNPRTNQARSRVRLGVLWPLGLLSLAGCAAELATQTVSPLERWVTTNAVTTVRDEGGGAGGVVGSFLRFHNTGTATLHIVLASCPFQLAAYRTEARQGAPAWAERPLCTLQPLVVELTAGARDSLSSSIPFREILGDSLPAGRYYFALHTTYEVLPYPRPASPTGPPKAYVFRGGDGMLHR